MAGFSIPSMRWQSDNLPEEFASFRQYCELIFGGPYSAKSAKEQCSYILLWIGRPGVDIYNSWTFADEADRFKVDELLSRFQAHLQPKVNAWLARFQLQQQRQNVGETTDDFLCRCRNLAVKCKFADAGEVNTRLLEQLIVGTRHKTVQEKLLEKGDQLSSLDEGLEVARTHEATATQMAQLTGSRSASVSPADVSFVKKSAPKRSKDFKKKQQKKSCQFCGKEDHDRAVCPARSAECNFCKKQGHFATVCQKKQRSCDAVHTVPPDAHAPGMFLGSVDAGRDPWSVSVEVNNSPVMMKIDTGADVSVIPASVFRLLDAQALRPSRRTLMSANSSVLDVAGVFDAVVTHAGKSSRQEIFVANNLKQALLGRPAIVALDLLDVKADISEVSSGIRDTATARAAYPDLFKPLGRFTGEPHCIRLEEGAKPFALSCPRDNVAIPLMPIVKAELEKMEKQGVIVPVDEPTDWCAGLVVVAKPGGEAVRLCVDYTRLNQHVRREQFVLPAVDHTLGQLGGAKYFTKLDANSGFYQVPLAKESQKLTTFITPFGRFMFTRLPFGICSAPEHFQKRMARILNGVVGTACQMDDALVFGSTEEEHDNRLHQVLQRLSDNGVTLNPDKCLFKVTSAKFLGHIIDQDGIHSDPQKVQGIQDFTPCQDVADVRSFLGLVNQLGKFSPSLASVSQPIRDLLKKGNAWSWGPPQQSAFEEIKALLSCTPVLALYSPEYPTIVSADASSYGLGAVIKQQQPSGDWKPVSFQSRALLPAERRYAQIEKEALGLTWACNRFSDYLIGKRFTLETDHKPLVPLFSTSALDSIPPRVLRFRLNLMRFDFDIVHIPGKDLIVADALSRSPASRPLSADDVRLLDDAEAFLDSVVSHLPASDARLSEIQHQQAQDPVCQHLVQYTLSGWPSLQSAPVSVKPYYASRQSFCITDGLLLYGSRIVIPDQLRPEVLQQLHAGHLGITKTRERARQSVWWPGLSAQLADIVSNCQACARDKPTPMEPLLSSRLPEFPWQEVAADFMQFQGSQYLVVVDYYSRWIELAQMSRTSAASLITQLKSMFARHGNPDVFVSDNGPPFTSAEVSAWLQEQGTTQRTSSPLHPQGNGLVERAVQTLKHLLVRGGDPYVALQSYRASPLAHGFSPAELLMGRRIQTRLPMSADVRRPYLVDRTAFAAKDASLKSRQASDFNSRHRALDATPLVPGTAVFVPDRKEPGIVTAEHSTRSLIVETPSGSVLRRNRSDLIVDPPAGSANDAVDNGEPASPAQRPSPGTPVPERSGRVTRSGRAVHTPIRFR
ncbi:uncharacterized protein K02A2.6-like [Sycon ciliatum]|uniref:uncharacterized protein K02A2.6-like n=1 Tax=Sycon ciliatum TaxID=27933 RepID=UPI0031F683F8